MSHLIRPQEHKLLLCFSPLFFFSLLLFSTDFLYSIFILPNLVWVHLHSCFLLVSSFFQPFLSELEHKFHILSEPLNPQCSSKQKTVTKLYALPAGLCFSKCELGITWKSFAKRDLHNTFFLSHLCIVTVHISLFYLLF